MLRVMENSSKDRNSLMTEATLIATFSTYF